jgi:fluoride ion exporter CrcB/FEX
MIHLLLVMAGGAAGSALRYGVSAALSAVPSLFPWSTILVNIVGSLHMLLGTYIICTVVGGISSS